MPPSKYGDGNSWEDAEAWLDATISISWTYDTSSVTFSNGHAYTVKAKSTDEAGNTSTEATDSFTYTIPSSGGGGGAAPEPPNEDILATSPDATGTDTDGKELTTTGEAITVTSGGEVLTINIPVALEKGGTLASFTDSSGLSFSENKLVIPPTSVPGERSMIRVVVVEGDLLVTLTMQTGKAVGTGSTAVADIESIKVGAQFTVQAFTAEIPTLVK